MVVLRSSRISNNTRIIRDYLRSSVDSYLCPQSLNQAINFSI
jgi:hypothetical protein